VSQDGYCGERGKRRELTFIITALILAAVLGGLVGDILGTFLPEGAAKTVFSKAIQIGFSPVNLDLWAISFTFGLKFKINFMSGLFVLLVVLYFRYWFL
jgi:hypothetical protein